MFLLGFCVFNAVNDTITIVMKPYMCLLQGGDTVLHKAAQNGQQDVLRLLISSGMSPDTEGLVSCYIAT